MKKIFMFLPLLAVAVMTACTSDDLQTENSDFEGKVIRAEICLDDASRTVLQSDGKVFWETTDQIAVGDARYKVSQVDASDNTKATFTYDNFGVPSSMKDAYYPYEVYTREGPALPAVQRVMGTPDANGVYTTLTGISPMHGVYDQATNTIKFKNLCSMFKVTLTNWEDCAMNIANVMLSCPDKALSGAFKVNADGAAVLTQAAQEAKKGVTLDCSDANITLEAGATVTFYVALPAGTYSNMQVTVKNFSGYTTTSVYTSPITIARSHVKRLNVTLDNWQAHPLDGLFTVDTDGKKVQFSPGLLWADLNNNCHFEPEQYIRVKPSSNDYNFGNDWVNIEHQALFHWSPTVADARKKTGPSPLTTIFTNDPDFKVDGLTGWYMLSNSETDYLLLKRTVGGKTGLATNGNAGSFSYIQVSYKGENIKGIAIYPDNYDGTFYPSIAYNATDVSCSASELTSKNIVFWPAIGTAKDGSYTWGNILYYWTSSKNNSGRSESLKSSGNGGQNTAGQGVYGENQSYPIRLVRAPEQDQTFSTSFATLSDENFNAE